MVTVFVQCVLAKNVQKIFCSSFKITTFPNLPRITTFPEIPRARAVQRGVRLPPPNLSFINHIHLQIIFADNFPNIKKILILGTSPKDTSINSIYIWFDFHVSLKMFRSTYIELNFNLKLKLLNFLNDPFKFGPTYIEPGHSFLDYI